MPSSLGFPSTPTLGQQYTIGDKTYVWDGTVWNTVTAGGGTPLSQEEVQDYIAPLFNHSSHSNLTAVYDDANNKILLNAQGGTGGAADLALIIGLS
jgi:ribosome biogenesis SPOUT family RNA methylase Rps3